MLVGYARISTKDQLLSLQVDALEKEGCEKIFTDTRSGKSLQRSGLTEALNYLREGDTLVVWKLDRLGRNVRDLVTLAQELKEKGIHLSSLHDGITTAGAMGNFFFHIIAAIAEVERETIRTRTLAGLEAARKAGKKLGRKRVMNQETVNMAKTLLAKGYTRANVARTLQISLATLYRYIPGHTL